MIIDSLKNAGMYYGVSSKLKAAFEYLQKTDFEKMEPGRYGIDGTNVYAMVQQYETKPMEQGAWEAHRKYIDIQYVYTGSELMGYSCIEGMKVVKEYDESGDYLLLEGEGNFFKVEAGYFAVFAPDDVHMPCIAIKATTKVKKVVVKVAVG